MNIRKLTASLAIVVSMGVISLINSAGGVAHSTTMNTASSASATSPLTLVSKPKAFRGTSPLQTMREGHLDACEVCDQVYEMCMQGTVNGQQECINEHNQCRKDCN